MNIQEAIKALITALNEDEEYRYSWQANIAMQFKDEWQRAVDAGGLPHIPEQIHQIANDAAVSFLNLLCRETT